MGKIHAGNPERSGRLKRVLKFLQKRSSTGATTMEIIEICKVCAVNSIVAELRACGYRIDCETRVEAAGARVARYWLRDPGQAVPA